MDAAYSNTAKPSTQLKKLGLLPGRRWAIVGRPEGWSFEIEPDGADQLLLDGALPGAADVVLAFVRVAAEIPALLVLLEPWFFPAGALWIAWPRRAGGHQSDITDSIVRDAALARSLVDTKVAAIDADWSALKLVWRVSARS